MVTVSRSIGKTAVVVATLALAACGTDYSAGGGAGPDPAALAVTRSEPSGDGQSGTTEQDLANPLRIVILKGSTPQVGTIVTWSANGTGSMAPGVDTTGADGISTSVWRLGTQVGTQRAQAAVTGAEGSPVPFTATASAPGGPASPVLIQLRSDGGNRFEPANVTIAAGTTITWTWIGGIHDVTSTGVPGFTGSGAPVSPPPAFSQTFTSPGTYVFFCTVHGTPSSGMRGTIVVQ
jgi:plastocyanin